MKTVPKIALARRFRKALTGPEFLLWERLKERTREGVVFRRQHPIGPFIVDFYCAKARLVIEVDGALHGEDAAQVRDEKRESYLCGKTLFCLSVAGGRSLPRS